MSDVVKDSLLMTSKQVMRMIGEPCTKRRLRFGEMLVNGFIEEMAIASKNRITKIIEFNNRRNSLLRPFTLVKLIVQAMTLIIAEVPNINNRV